MRSAKRAAASEIAELVAELRLLPTAMLRTRLEDLTREPCRSGNKEWLIQRIAWVTQARREGGLPERARARALSIARDEDIRYRPTTAFVSTVQRCSAEAIPTRDPRLPMPGAEIVRVYKGARIVVRVLEDAGGGGATVFEYAGRRYRSLTSIATEITGSTWNGFHFFGLEQGGTHGKG